MAALGVLQAGAGHRRPRLAAAWAWLRARPVRAILVSVAFIAAAWALALANQSSIDPS